ncbi:hypothetical protein P8452_67775 [Trifolium repens]|nr:hypothetical protein P8452_67775 [Trifolium repens]
MFSSFLCQLSTILNHKQKKKKKKNKRDLSSRSPCVVLFSTIDPIAKSYILRFVHPSASPIRTRFGD